MASPIKTDDRLEERVGEDGGSHVGYGLRGLMKACLVVDIRGWMRILVRPWFDFYLNFRNSGTVVERMATVARGQVSWKATWGRCSYPGKKLSGWNLKSNDGNGVDFEKEMNREFNWAWGQKRRKESALRSRFEHWGRVVGESISDVWSVSCFGNISRQLGIRSYVWVRFEPMIDIWEIVAYNNDLNTRNAGCLSLHFSERFVE